MIPSGVFLCLVGVLQAVMDTLDFHYGSSVFMRLKNQQYWDQDVSWKNKYAKADGNEVWINKPRFLGSTTVFVWVTDGWHLTEAFRNTAIVLSVLFFPGIALDWWFLAYLVAGKVIVGTSFEATFRALKVKKLE